MPHPPYPTLRITPAYAGSMPATTAVINGTRDHPRIRGEHTGSGANCPLGLGSPPHTRGALNADIIGGHAVGITPAYAGSILYLYLSLAWTRDHPRIRGEHPVRVQVCRLRQGSPPHTRGAYGGGFRRA